MQLFRILRSTWIWTASSALIMLWTPLLFLISLFERDPRRVRTGRWFRRLGRLLARLSGWHILISGLENLERVAHHGHLAVDDVHANFDQIAKDVVGAAIGMKPNVHAGVVHAALPLSCVSEVWGRDIAIVGGRFALAVIEATSSRTALATVRPELGRPRTLTVEL